MFSIKKLIVFLEISIRTIKQLCGLETPGKIKLMKTGTSLVVQWLRLHTPNGGGPQAGSLVRELDPTCGNYEFACRT